LDVSLETREDANFIRPGEGTTCYHVVENFSGKNKDAASVPPPRDRGTQVDFCPEEASDAKSSEHWVTDDSFPGTANGGPA
jgi:hypothetical protein